MKRNLIFKSVSVMSVFAIVFSLTSVTAYADEPEVTYDDPIIANIRDRIRRV